MGSKRGGWVVNSRHKKCINGNREKKEKEDNGRIRKISKKGRCINKKEKKREGKLSDQNLLQVKLKSLYICSWERKVFINKIIGES